MTTIPAITVERDNFGRDCVRLGPYTLRLAPDGRIIREHFVPARGGFETPVRRTMKGAYADSVRNAINGARLAGGR